jgi:protein-tyrosine phosphatase
MFRQLVEDKGYGDQFEIDSAGTAAYHIGSPPDDRAVRAAHERGIDLSTLRARQISRPDLSHFDYILAMDHDNLKNLRSFAEKHHPEARPKIKRLLEYSNTRQQEVPDPYYGGNDGFTKVLDMLAEAGDGLLQHIIDQRTYR